MEDLNDRLAGVEPAQLTEPPKKLTFEEKLKNYVPRPPIEEDPAHYNAIAHMHAHGATAEQIAVMLGLPIEEIAETLKIERVQSLVNTLRKKAAGRDHKSMFKMLMPDAIEVARTIMMDNSVKSSTRLAAASLIMDRAHGKATQTIDVGGTLLRDLFDQIDKMERSHAERAIAAEHKRVDNAEEGTVVSSSAPEQPKEAKMNPIDSWAKANLK